MDKAVKFIKRKFGRGFTFLVVPNSSGGGTKSITIPFSVALVIVLIIVINISIFLGFFIQVGTIYGLNISKNETDHLNRKLLKEQAQVKPTLKKSYKMVAELNELKKELTRLNTTWKSIQQKGGRNYNQVSRGTSVRINSYIIKTPETNHDTMKTSLEELKFNMSQIKGFIQEEKEEQQNLLTELVAYERILDHTPSKWPVATSIVSWFGLRFHPVYRTTKEHEGVDLEAAYGTKVHAAAEGIVSFTGWDGGYGNLVKIDHGYGYETRYGHNSKILVYTGQAVKKGQIICISGSTGVATGPHLHYEVRINNVPVNPVPYLRN